MSLWTATDAAAATGGEAKGDWVANGVSIDTRTIREGDLFVALKDVRDGHDFVAQALGKGAAAALVNRVPEGVPDDASLLLVPDVLAALEALGRAGRARTKATVIGVTGSVGKTSTKEMLREVLSRQGRTHAAEASYNNHWGVPLTLARMPVDTEYAIIEIGMSHPGEIAPLSRLARPHVAMVTTVAAAHLEAFGSLDAIAREKASIVAGLEPGGAAILNNDLQTTDILIESATDARARIVTFGERASDWRLTDLRLTPDATVLTAQHEGASFLFKLGVAGRHFALNALAVIAAVEAAGGDPAMAAQDIAHWAPPAGRGTRERVVLDPANEDETLDLIDDAFNANPTSMAAAFEVLDICQPKDGVGRIVKGRRIAILGDMLELGDDEIALHQALAAHPSLAAVDLVHLAGPRMKALHDALPDSKRGRWSPDAPGLAAQVAQIVDAGDVVLVKGSKGSKVSLVVDAIRKLGHR